MKSIYLIPLKLAKSGIFSIYLIFYLLITMMEKYSYNYDFLREWMAQEGLSVNDVKDALGVSDKNNIYFWAGVSKEQREQRERGEEPGRRPLPLKHILRLCNKFDINLERFFLPTESGAVLNMDYGKQVADLEARLRETKKELDHERELRKACQQTIETQKIAIEALQHQHKGNRTEADYISPSMG